MAPTLKIGIAGLGNEGRRVVPYFATVAGVELSAVADVRQEVLDSFQQQHSGAETFTTVDEMCRWAGIDAVWIATPSDLHPEHTLTAIEHGKHVILEKPMALSLEVASQMVEAAERAGTHLLMHSHAADPPIRKIREIVQSGRLGRLIAVNTWSYKGWLRSPRLASELDTSKGGGVVFRQAPHQIEIVRHIAGGQVRSVFAYTGRWNPHFDTEGNYTALLEFEDGTPATLVFNGYGYFNITDLTWKIGESGYPATGTYGPRVAPTAPVERSAYYENGGREDRDGSPDERRQPIFGLTIVSCERGDIRQSPDGLYLYSDEGCEEIACAPYADRAQELVELRDAVAEDRPVFPDGRWGMATFETQLAILQSAREHRPVQLSHQTGVPV